MNFKDDTEVAKTCIVPNLSGKIVKNFENCETYNFDQ